MVSVLEDPKEREKGKKRGKKKTSILTIFRVKEDRTLCQKEKEQERDQVDFKGPGGEGRKKTGPPQSLVAGKEPFARAPDNEKGGGC